MRTRARRRRPRAKGGSPNFVIPYPYFTLSDIGSFNKILDWWIQKQKDGYDDCSRDEIKIHMREWYWGSRINLSIELKRFVNYEFTEYK